MSTFKRKEKSLVDRYFVREQMDEEIDMRKQVRVKRQPNNWKKYLENLDDDEE